MRQHEPNEERLALAGGRARRRNLFLRVRNREIRAVRAIEGTPGGTIALARIAQDLTITILDFDGGGFLQRGFHPAIEPDLGVGKRRIGVVRRRNLRFQSLHALSARRGDGDRELGDFVLHCF